MSDQILTDKSFDSLVEKHRNQNSVWRRLWTEKLLISHRLLTQRLRELARLERRLDAVKQEAQKHDAGCEGCTVILGILDGSVDTE